MKTQTFANFKGYIFKISGGQQTEKNIFQDTRIFIDYKFNVCK